MLTWKVINYVFKFSIIKHRLMDGHLGKTKETLEITYLTIDYRPEELGIYL